MAMKLAFFTILAFSPVDSIDWLQGYKQKFIQKSEVEWCLLYSLTKFFFFFVN